VRRCEKDALNTGDQHATTRNEWVGGDERSSLRRCKVKKKVPEVAGWSLKSVDALMDPGRQSRGLPDMLLVAAGAGAADALLETGSG
jgi:hypothetical protein